MREDIAVPDVRESREPVEGFPTRTPIQVDRAGRDCAYSLRVGKYRSGLRQTKLIAAKRPPARAELLWLSGILLLTFAAYIPSLNNGFTNWDDPLFVLDNPLLANPNAMAVLTTPIANNYHPLTIWSLALNYRLAGLNPVSYHWLNLLLHLANTGLVFVFIRQLTRGRLWATVVTSLLFGIHPMHVESVAWIAERKDVLYALFYLLGLVAYLRYIDGRGLGWLGATLLAFVLSAASKPAAVVFPLTLFAIDFYRRRPFRWHIVLEKVPFLALSLLDGVLTLHSQQATGAIDLQRWGPSFQKVLFASYGTMMYAVKLFVPVHLSAIYPYPRDSERLAPEFYLAFALALIALPTIIYLCRRSRPALFGMAFFFINIVLVLQLFTVGQAVMADRYAYLPYIGLFFAFAWWLDERPTPSSIGRTLRLALIGSLALLVPFSLYQTWKRCEVWKSSETLWSDTIQRYPHRIVDAYYNRGLFYLYQNGARLGAALADFDQAIALNPRAAKAWLNKGIVLSERNQVDSAFVCVDRALQIQPDLFAAWSERGRLKARRGDLAGAVADFSRSIAINPRYREAYRNRALVYTMTEEYEKSIRDSRRVIELDPKSPDNYVQIGSIGVALEHLNRYTEAVAELDGAIRLAPHGNWRLGVYFLYRSYAKWALGEQAGALDDAREALRLGAKIEPAYLHEIGI